MKKLIFLSFLITLTAIGAFGQSATTLRNRCPNTSIYSVVQITGVGDINVQPCPNKTTTFTQNVVLPAGTVIAGGMFKANNGTAALPSYAFVNSTTTGLFRSAADVLGISTAGVANTTFGAVANTFTSPTQTFTSSTAFNSTSPIQTFTGATSINNNTALFNVNNAAANAEFKLVFTAGAANLGSTIIGDSTGAGNTYVAITNASNDVTVVGRQIALGDLGSGNGTNINFTDAGGIFDFARTAATAVFDLDKVLNYQLYRTITAGGTTGNQTISRPNGSVNIAAGAASIVITNTTVTTSSTIIAVANTNDATCAVKNAVPTANTITITMTAACTAETRVAFWVFN